jgi:branched-chain amino acid transport system ATP-binding protein
MELFPELKSIETQSAWKLSGGQQQMVAVGRALMGDPKLLMLDEPSLGLAPIVARRVLERVRRLCDQGRSVLLVEQNARAALEVADRGYVLMEGEVRLEGSSSTLSEGELLQDVYLGEL